MGVIPESTKDPQAAGPDIAAPLLWRDPCLGRILASKSVSVSFESAIASARQDVLNRQIRDDEQYRENVMTQAGVCV